MSLDVPSILKDHRERLERLERQACQKSPPGRTNLAGAARYLNMSDEALRQRHARGEGPKRGRNGRMWSYSFADLDEYARDSSDTAA